MYRQTTVVGRLTGSVTNLRYESKRYEPERYKPERYEPKCNKPKRYEPKRFKPKHCESKRYKRTATNPTIPREAFNAADSWNVNDTRHYRRMHSMAFY